MDEPAWMACHEIRVRGQLGKTLLFSNHVTPAHQDGRKA
jgi:hypothetical protein